MTPQERRKKYPLPPVTPMTPAEIELLRLAAEAWLAEPMFTDHVTDRRYHTQARLLATMGEWES